MRRAYVRRPARSTVLVAAAIAAGACAHRADRAPAEPRPTASTLQLLDRAHDAERARRYDRARALYEDAARTAPDPGSRSVALRELADALLFWGELADAQRALEQLVAVRPGEASAWHDLGVVRSRRGDGPGGERALRRAVQLAPTDPRPRIALGALLVSSRRWNDALAEYRALDRLNLPVRVRRAVAQAVRLIEAERARAPR